MSGAELALAIGVEHALAAESLAQAQFVARKNRQKYLATRTTGI